MQPRQCGSRTASLRPLGAKRTKGTVLPDWSGLKGSVGWRLWRAAEQLTAVRHRFPFNGTDRNTRLDKCDDAGKPPACADFTDADVGGRVERRSRRRSRCGARSSLSQLTVRQLGMSAGRDLIKWKSEPRGVWRRLEPSLSDGASAEEEGLDRFFTFNRNFSIFECHNKIHDMKSHRITTLLLSVSFAVFFIGCAEKSIEPFFRVTPMDKEYTFPPEGGSVEYTIDSSEEWFFYTKNFPLFTYGKTRNGIKVEASPYYSDNSSLSRSDYVKVSATGFDPVFLLFSQTPEYMIIKQKEYHFGDEGGGFTLLVDSNTDWQLSADADWISLEQVKGTNSGSIKVNVASHTSPDATTGHIVCSTEHITTSVSIVRDGYKKKYTIGDIYPDTDNPQGIVVEITNNGKNGKAIALSTSMAAWSYEYWLIGTSATDGLSNTDKAIERANHSSGGYTIFFLCRNKGENWYLPAYREVYDAVNVINSLADKEESWKEYGWDSLPTVLMSSTEAGSSEYQAWQTGSSPVKRLNKKISTYARAMCQF